MQVRRECRAFPAYTQGPAEFYARRVLPARPRPRPADPIIATVRPAHFARQMPRFTTSAPVAAPPPAKAPLHEHPVFVALALTLLPPAGVPLLWASPRFSTAAKGAITAFLAFCIAVAAIAFCTYSRVCG